MMRSLAAFTIVAVACTKQEPSKLIEPTKPIVSEAAVIKAAPRACTSKAPPGRSQVGTPGCKSDSECTVGVEGRCDYRDPGRMPSANVCSYDTCKADQDCAQGTLCSCGGTGETARNLCTPANCHDDADCAGKKCQRSPAGAGDTSPFGSAGHYCTTNEDQCAPADKCATGQVCAFRPPHSRWECLPMHYMPPG